MARGWESKSVESQQDAAEARVREKAPPSPVAQEIAAWEHTRKHLQDEIAGSGNPRFRELKGKALAHIEAQIASLKDKEAKNRRSSS